MPSSQDSDSQDKLADAPSAEKPKLDKKPPPEQQADAPTYQPVKIVYAQPQVVYVQQPQVVHIDVPDDADLVMDDKGELFIRFAPPSVRAKFIRKVFLLVSIMLAVVTVMTMIPFTHPSIMAFVRRHFYLYWISFVIFFTVYILLICVERVRRSFPCNLITCSILTLSLGYMTMMISAYHDFVSVLLALIVTTCCCLFIIIFSLQIKYDLTSWVGVVALLGFGLCMFGIVAMISAFAFHVRWLLVVYAGLGALLFMAYLAIDIQMLCKGKKHTISTNEPVFAAIQIFIDIVFIFMMLLAVIGCLRS